MKKTLLTNDMTTGCIWMQLVSFAAPLMVENIFQLLYNTADTIIVGRYIGDYALSAVGATSQVIYAFTLIFLVFPREEPLSLHSFLAQKISSF